MKELAVSQCELVIILDILKDYRKDVLFFGSRVKGTSKKFSDLDVCIKAKISDADLELLQEKFDNSDLPFKVDIVLYSSLSEEFKKLVDVQGVNLL